MLNVAIFTAVTSKKFCRMSITKQGMMLEHSFMPLTVHIFLSLQKVRINSPFTTRTPTMHTDLLSSHLQQHAGLYPTSIYGVLGSCNEPSAPLIYAPCAMRTLILSLGNIFWSLCQQFASSSSNLHADILRWCIRFNTQKFVHSNS